MNTPPFATKDDDDNHMSINSLHVSIMFRITLNLSTTSICTSICNYSFVSSVIIGAWLYQVFEEEPR